MRIRVLLLTVGALLALVLVASAALPLFLNTEGFKSTIESSASRALARPVQIASLHVSLLSGGLVAEGLTIGDDPSFSNGPFLQAERVKVGVALWPLVTRREVEVRGFALTAPRVQLLRNAAGMWNYGSLGRGTGKSAKASVGASSQPKVTVGKITIDDGLVSVRMEPKVGGDGSPTSLVYQEVSLKVSDFGFARSFPFAASAKVAGGGTISVRGSAGPVNAGDRAETPFSVHLEAKQLDPVAAGLVSTDAGVAGQVGSLAVDAGWNGQQLHVQRVSVDSPRLTVVRRPRPAPTTVKAAATTPSLLTNLVMDSFELNDGTVSVISVGASRPVIYQGVHASLTRVSSAGPGSFEVTARLPGGGSLRANGDAGPFNFVQRVATPVRARLSMQRVALASSGFVSRESEIAGTADLDAQITSDGQVLHANGIAKVAGLQLAKSGVPSRVPVGAQFSLAQNEQAMSGQIERGRVTIGPDAIDVTGTYQKSGAATTINLKVDGRGMSVNGLQAFLPSVGVKLPQGSRLEGGTLTVALNVSGAAVHPQISGPVSLENTQLAGFDLNSKLAAVTRLSGAPPSSTTAIRSLSMTIRTDGGRIATDRIAVDIPTLGTATGSGTVDHGALAYRIVVKPNVVSKALGRYLPGGAKASSLAGQLLGMIASTKPQGITGVLLGGGIPVAIGGTTTNPTFAPDLGAGGKTAGPSAAVGGAGRRRP